MSGASTMATKHQIHLRSQNPAPVAYFTGGYGGDGWTPRAEVLHQNVFAVDAPDSELVHALAIQRRQNPFAYPGEWLAQFRLRAALATRHVRNAVLHAKSGDSHPFLGGWTRDLGIPSPAALDAQRRPGRRRAPAPEPRPRRLAALCLPGPPHDSFEMDECVGDRGAGRPTHDFSSQIC